MKLKLKMSRERSSKVIFDFNNYSTKSKYYDDSNKLVIEKIKNETAGVLIEEFSGLESKMYPSLIEDNSKHKKAKGVNKNVASRVSYNGYMDVLLKNNV